MISLDKDKGGAGAAHLENMEKLKVYGLVLAVLAGMAAISFLAIPGGSGISRCSSVVQQNRYGCIESMAVSTGNSTMCGFLAGSYSDSCYMAIAENSSSAALCGKVSDQNLSNVCLSYVAISTNDSGTCMMISGSGKDACVLKIALDSENATACSLMGNAGLRSECTSTVYFDRALALGNASQCAYLSANADDNATYSMMGNSNIADYGNLYLNMSQLIEYAAYYNSSVSPRDACYMSMAFLSENSAYCSSANDTVLGSMCRTLITRNVTVSLNATGASAVNYTSLGKQCSASGGNCAYAIAYIRAIESDNVSECGSIPAPASYQCYYAFATRYNDTGYCSYIGNATANSDCVLSVVGAYGNGNGTAVS